MDLIAASGHAELETLSRRYAAAMDHRDRAALLAVFTPDASMRVEQPGRGPGLLRGHSELRRLTVVIGRWPRTVHLLAQGLYELDGSRAIGEIYCTAHHFSSADAGLSNDHVMHIRYRDNYRLDENSRWRISHRTVTVEATEDRQVHVSAASV
jgi:hypothetical protein